MPLIYPNPIKALQDAFQAHHSKKNFIFIETEKEIEMSTFKEAIPGHDFFNVKNEGELKSWLESNDMNQHIVLQDFWIVHNDSEVSGMEFLSMMYFNPICLKCGKEEDKPTSFITRAKASLLLAKYEKQNCCQNKSYPNLKWNNESKKWEIEQGFTIDHLPEESREILEITSKLRELLFLEDIASRSDV